MNNPENYPWATAYVSAALETDISKRIGHIAKAERAIKDRFVTHTQTDDLEHRAIEAAQRALATLKTERVAGSVSKFRG